jgi:hypothetical protein
MHTKPGEKKDEIKEPTVLMKGNKKRKERSYLYACHKDKCGSECDGVAALSQTRHEIE